MKDCKPQALRMFSDLVAAVGARLPCRLSSKKTTALQMVDVGCGIGGSSRHIARRLGCAARGITLSPVQVPSPARIYALSNMLESSPKQPMRRSRSACIMLIPFLDSPEKLKARSAERGYQV